MQHSLLDPRVLPLCAEQQLHDEVSSLQALPVLVAAGASGVALLTVACWRWPLLALITLVFTVCLTAQKHMTLTLRQAKDCQ